MQKQGLVNISMDLSNSSALKLSPHMTDCLLTGPSSDPANTGQFAHWRCVSLQRRSPTTVVDRNRAIQFPHTSHLLIAAASCQPAVKLFQPSGYKVAFECWTVRKPQPSQQLVVGVVLQVLKGFPFIPLKTEDSLRPLFEGMLSSSGRRLSTYTNLLSLRREKESCVCCATVADEDVWLTWFRERETLIWGVNTGTALCG